ncbi:hypothetical protein ONE63_003483 [Megalurothrips usitatus]|uniref:Uncharacterized protein n=1 Tax=Megalurothrips usitatus TaxID=439358 RepID=A0AAV7X7E5_9NEOP|nr:hypothetical protein ONE63_003483 [Megalurothrips usitatus]
MSLDPKRVGRPVGTNQRAYTSIEVETAFKTLVEVCPKNVSGQKFLSLLQDKMQKACGGEMRTTQALQTFVKGKLRKAVPHLYDSLYTRRGKEPSVAEWTYLREYMKDVDWRMSRPPKPPKKDAPGDGESKSAKKTAREENQKDLKKATRGAAAAGSSSTPSTPSTSRKGEGGSPFAAFYPPLFSTPKGGVDKDNMDVVLGGLLDRRLQTFREEVMTELKEMCSPPSKQAPDRPVAGAWRRKGNEQAGCGLETTAPPEIIVLSSSSEVEEGNASDDEEPVGRVKEEREDRPQDGPGEAVEAIPPISEEMMETGSGPADERQPGAENGEAVVANPPISEEMMVVSSGPGDERQSEGEYEGDSEVVEVDNDSDQQVISVATSAEALERSRAIACTPVRARLSTLTVVEVFKVTNAEEAEDDSTFRVIEEQDGTLTLWHSSLVDPEQWSQQVTIDHKNNATLTEELASVHQQDIVQMCQDGQCLSPMTVSQVSKNKRSFQAATLNSKDRVVRALFKRRDD